MDNFVVILLALSLMIIVSGMADKVKMPAPMLLVIVGIVVGYLHPMPALDIDPEVIMVLFLPPMLYDAAFNISFNEFRSNLGLISRLAIALVFLTTAGIAVLAYYIVPGMTWSMAFVLGAILSATDAVAAIGVTKGLNLPHRITTILEGESLVNDASALIAYKFAVAAITGYAFHLGIAALDFIIVLGGGLLVGFVISKVLSFVLLKFRSNDMVVISLKLLMPYFTYLIAEHFQFSGVIAVVVFGLFMAKFIREEFQPRVREQSQHFWSVITFMLNGLAFLLIGLEFPRLLTDIPLSELWIYLLYAVLIVVVTIVIRFVMLYWQQKRLVKIALRRRSSPNEELFTTKTSFILSWSGMRGIVSLAIALALPDTLENGEPFPMQSGIIFIAFTVVVISLLGQGLTLPWIVRKLRPS